MNKMFSQDDDHVEEMILFEKLANELGVVKPPDANDTEEHLFSQLNQLRLWRDSQQEKLMSNQLTQSQLLNLEKNKLYELLGLSVTSNDSEASNDDVYSTDDENEMVRMDIHNDMDDDNIGCDDAVSDGEEISTPRTQIEMPIRKSFDLPTLSQPKKATFNTQEQPKCIADSETIPKRPFLKRGEGLTLRFKVAPDAFRLDKLPKYKYSRRVAQALSKRQPAKQQQQKQQQPAAAAQYRDGRGGCEGRLNNSSIDKTPDVENINRSRRESGKRNGTGCLKLIPRKLTSSWALNGDSEDNTRKQNANEIYDGTKGNVIDAKLSHTAFGRVTNPSTTPLFDTPIRNRVEEQQKEINELNVFEFLERRFAATLAESTPINKPFDTIQAMAEARSPSDAGKGLRTASIRPARCAVSQRRSEPQATEQESPAREADQGSFYSSDEEPRHVHFASHVVKYLEPDDNISMTEVEEPTILNDTPTVAERGAMGAEATAHVAPISSADSFQRFKEKLFDRKLKQKFKNQLSVAKNTLGDVDEDTELMSVISNQSSNYEPTEAQMESHPILSADLQAKNDLLQQRLGELETEITTFKEQNSELTKLIREHEVIRLEFEEERQATQEQLNDERIKIEVYLHDENMKLVNERKELDRKVKELQKPNRSERDEIVKLKEQCANHEKDLNARDQKHIAAQARLRAQLRNVEKELKEAQFDLENFQKENKKLEAENARLRRQSNNKMLQEINRNIAKLAPVQHQNGENTLNNNHEGNKASETRSSKSIKSKSLPHTHAAKECTNKTAHRSVVARVTSSRSSTPSNGHSGRLRSKSVPNLQQSQETHSSPSFSDGEIDNASESESTDANDRGRSSYFRSSPAAKSRSSYSREDVPERKSKSPTVTRNDSTGSTKNSYKRVIDNADGSKDIWYPNGNLKKMSADGMCIRMLYYNKDIKETNIAEGTVRYYYAETNTWHTTYIDGLEILEFPNGQREHRFKDGTIEVHFPNGSVRITNPYKEKNDGIREEWKYPDGTHVVQKTNGDKLLLLPNGQREVHTNGHKRREYPDGTVKIVYPDGSTESRYSNGRVRLKDKDGKLVMDSETIFV